MFSKKVVLGMGAAMLIVFSTVVPAFASMAPEEVKMEGTVQSVDLATSTFTLLLQDGSTATVTAPAGFDLSTLVVGDTVEAKGTAGADGVVTITKIETSTVEFEVEVESEFHDVNDDNGGQGEVEDESNDINDDNGGQGEVENNDDHGGDSHQDSDSQSGSNSGESHGGDSGSSHGGDSGSDSSHDD
jgi:hypothetical protein